MAITSVKRKVGRVGSLGEGKSNRYTETYQVISNSSADDAFIVGTASFGGVSIPRVSDQHPSDPDALVVRVDPRETAASGTKWSWDVPVEYSTESEDEAGSGGGSGSPTEQAPVRSVSSAKESRVVERAVPLNIPPNTNVNFVGDVRDFGRAPHNTVGDVISPISETFGLSVLTVVKNQVLTISQLLDLKDFYEDSLNSTPFYNRPKYWARMTGINGVQKAASGIKYFEVTYEVTFKRGGWQRAVLNRGQRAKDSAEKPYEIQPPGTERNLSIQDSTILADQSQGEFLEWITLDVRNWSGLSL